MPSGWRNYFVVMVADWAGTAGVVNSFSAFRTVLYTPQAAGTPTISHAASTAPADVFLTSCICLSMIGSRGLVLHPVLLGHRAHKQVAKQAHAQQCGHDVQNGRVRLCLGAASGDVVIQDGVDDQRNDDACR